MDKIKEIIRKKLREMSATSGGGASFSAGQGMNYATPKAFKKTKSIEEGPGATLGMGPSAGAEGVKDNAYVKQFKYKLVPKKIKGSGLEVKQLWEEDTLNEVNEFQQKRLDALDEIEKLMNEISPLISNAKNETIELYSGNAGSYDITKPIEMVKSYLQDIKQLLSEK
jgi:hypothetical protein